MSREEREQMISGGINVRTGQKLRPDVKGVAAEVRRWELLVRKQLKEYEFSCPELALDAARCRGRKAEVRSGWTQLTPGSSSLPSTYSTSFLLPPSKPALQPPYILCHLLPSILPNSRF